MSLINLRFIDINNLFILCIFLYHFLHVKFSSFTIYFLSTYTTHTIAPKCHLLSGPARERFFIERFIPYVTREGRFRQLRFTRIQTPNIHRQGSRKEIAGNSGISRIKYYYRQA